MLFKENYPLCLPKVEPYWNFVWRLLSCKRFHPKCQYFVISSTSLSTGVKVILVEEPVGEICSFMHCIYFPCCQKHTDRWPFALSIMKLYSFMMLHWKGREKVHLVGNGDENH